MSDILAWFLSPELGRDKLSLLVLCSVAMHILGTNLAWWLSPGRSLFGRLAVQVLRALYCLGIPAAVLWRGALVAEMGIPTTYAGEGVLGLQVLGLSGAQDLLRLGQGILLTAGGIVLLVALWTWYARVAPSQPHSVTPMPWWVALREALFLQVHWAFYRGVAATYTPDPVYVALASLILIGVPWVLDPRRRYDLLTPKGYLVVQDGLCALFTAVLSLSVSALWLLIAAHALWLWVGGRALARAAAIDGNVGAQSTIAY